jgi:hypothetical protein
MKKRKVSSPFDRELQTLKDTLKNRRKLLRWSQTVAAQKAGIPWISYQRLESPGYTFEVDTLIKVMLALDISFKSLGYKKPGALPVDAALEIDFNNPIDLNLLSRKNPLPTE